MNLVIPARARSGRPESGDDGRSCRCAASRSPPTPTARSIGPSTACSRSPICIWKKARASPRAACCCRLTIPRRRLARLARLIARYAPRCVVALGDSFHDGGGPARLVRRRPRQFARVAARARLDLDHRQSRSRAGGRTSAACSTTTLALGALTFRHLPTGADGEIAGHLHPVARIAQRGRAVSRRCFAADETRMVMPAFGAYHRRAQCARRRLRRSVRHAGLHRAHAGRGPALRLRRQALPAGLTPSLPAKGGRGDCLNWEWHGGMAECSILLNTTLAIQPMSSAISAVAMP